VSRFRFLDAEKASYPVRLLCRLVDASRAGYYAWLRRSPAARAQADACLTEEIRRIHTQSRQTYGTPRIHAALCARGQRVSRKRVARLLRAAGLRGCGVRRRVRTTVSDPAATPAPNLVQRQFDAGELDRVWVTDSTYLPTAEGWLYLAAILDGCSRRVIGWAMADHLRTELALEALDMALRERGSTGAALTHQSDRGCQYTAAAYQAVLAVHEIRCSMSRTGNCYDNAQAESFWATLKRELLPADGWATRALARAAVFEWIAVYYNRQRLHSSLGYRTPVNFETSKGHHQAA
jgi:transposase InsO family protein